MEKANMKTRVRALIVQEAKILLIHRIKGGQEYWVFPGGGLEEGDSTPQQGLVRECLEELGVTVKVGTQFAERPSGSGAESQVERFYICSIVAGEVGPAKGPESGRDPRVYGTYQNEWVPLTELAVKNVQPNEIRDKVVSASW